ncbi:MAG: lipopolysaccharide biosynthesis protein, partial [Saprospiraceae bacterium]
WTFLDRFANQIIHFESGIVLARLLSPEEYGLVGMLTIFMAVADTFISTGFGEALIRKTDPSKADYSTVFWLNIGTGFAFYLLFYLLAPSISAFFGEPLLQDILVVLSLSIIINAFGLVPRVPLIKKLDFKSFTKVSITATTLSGIVAIVLAINGFGVWSLVWRNIINSLITTIFIYLLSKPQFSLQFSRQSFNEFFGFGSNLLFSRLLNEVYNNMYYLVIGKFFSARELGLYTRANGYKDLPSKTLNNVIQGVSYPILAGIKDDDVRLKKAYRRLIQGTMYLTFVLMFSLSAAAPNFIIGLIGEKWADVIPYLQLLCFVGIFYPLNYLNLNMMVVKGRTDLRLRLEIIRKLIAVPVIFIGIYFGIKIMLVAMIFMSFIDYYLTASGSGRLIHYTFKEQVADIYPSFLLALSVSVIVYLVGLILTTVPPLFTLIIQSSVGFIFAVTVSNYFNVKPFLEMKQIIFSKLKLSTI